MVLVAYDGLQSLDLTGPLEVFHGATRIVGAASGYRVSVRSLAGAAVSSSSGLRIAADGDLRRLPARIDTLLVPGGSGRRAAEADERLLELIRLAAARARRTASVCTGAFLLAAAGLLAGRRATTHWASAAELAERHPDVQVDADPIFLRDGSLITSAGVTAGIDMALALVEEDLSREVALQIARHLVLFLRRPGNQSQFSAALAAREPARRSLRDLQREVLEDLAGDHRVEALAARAHMSVRHFSRAFASETGLTPARWVERVRLEAARRLLEEGPEPVALVAQRCGFGTAETMRRAFTRALGVGPAEYRRRFRFVSTAA